MVDEFDLGEGTIIVPNYSKMFNLVKLNTLSQF
jgi:hypothetical protein